MLVAYAQFSRSDLADIGMHSLPHFGCTVIHLDCAILVNQHQCARLIQMCNREADAELHRSDRQATLSMRTALVPFGNCVPPADEVARFLQLAPNGQDAVVCNFLPVMSRVGLSFAV